MGTRDSVSSAAPRRHVHHPSPGGRGMGPSFAEPPVLHRFSFLPFSNPLLPHSFVPRIIQYEDRSCVHIGPAKLYKVSEDSMCGLSR